jgi:hypothetical protein
MRPDMTCGGVEKLTSLEARNRIGTEMRLELGGEAG